MVNNFTKYSRFYKVPMLYQKIQKIIFSIPIIILIKINWINYIIENSKSKNTIYKYNSIKVNVGIKKAEKIVIC